MIVLSEPACNDEQRALECIMVLLRHGARVDDIDSNGMTPLFWTIDRAPHWLDAIKELLDHGANSLPRAPSTPFFKTALGCA
jgi:ankyrin repeat protein